MPGQDHFIPQPVNEAINRLEKQLLSSSPFRFCGPPVAITFPTANVNTEVLHRVGEVPHGYVAVDDGGALLKRAPGVQWTKDLAYLQSNTANVTAVLVFVVLREEPRNVNP